MIRGDAASSTLPSIRRRLTVTALAGMLSTALAAAAVSAFAVSVVVERLMKSSLEETAQALVVLAEHERDVEAMTHGGVLPAPPHEEALAWQLRSAQGAVIARSHGAPVTPWPVSLFEGHQRTGELAVFTIAGERYWLQVAQPLRELFRAQQVAAAQAAAAVLLLGVLGAILLAWQLRRELQPVARLALDVNAIEPSAAAPQLPRSPRLELEPVYEALEDLGERLAQRLRSEQAFSAHAAHSLRTPLAGLSAQLELILARPADPFRARVELALGAVRRLSGVVDALLVLARTGGVAHLRPFDAEALVPAALAQRMDVDCGALSGIVLDGDPDLLAAALANLIDNSARHGAHGAVVRAGHGPSTAQWIEVVDDGPGIDGERLAELRAALANLDASGRVDEALGLGLTLTGLVARAHGGHVDLQVPDGAGGLTVRLRWVPGSRVE